MQAEAEKWRTQEYFPALRRQKGFIQVFLAIPDEPGDKAVEVELWESREALETWHNTKEFQEIWHNGGHHIAWIPGRPYQSVL